MSADASPLDESLAPPVSVVPPLDDDLPPAPRAAPPPPPPPPPPAVEPEAVDPFAAVGRKVAVVGFTPTRSQAPYDDPEWAVWGMNDLHAQPGVAASKFDAWFDLHDERTILSNAEHVRWLESGADGLPVLMWHPRPEWPTSCAFPREAIVSRYGRYFTNSVSWMLALAVDQVMAHATPEGDTVPEGAALGVFGVDMAQGTEYAAQRPSCEFFLGLASGLGFSITIPDTSDLLKAAGLYGYDEGAAALRARLEERNAHLRQALAEHEAQERAHHDAACQVRGAIENNDYVLAVWTQPAAKREGAS